LKGPFHDHFIKHIFPDIDIVLTTTKLGKLQTRRHFVDTRPCVSQCNDF